MKVELIDIGRVVPYARNPRRNENAIAKVASSIKEYGFRQPIVVDEELVIIAGHTRLQAAQSLGLKKLPVHIATGLTSAQIKAYRLADNRTHEDAEWDEELLAIELGELDELGFDLDLTGFETIELEKLLDGAAMDGLTDDDEVPEAPETPVSKEGDAADGNAAQRGATRGNTAQRKKGKKDPDTDRDTDTDLDENTDADADADLKKEKDKNLDAREEKKESEEEKPSIGGKDKNQILHQMLDIWNEEVQSKITNGQKAILTPKRKELLTLRFIDEFAEDIRAWRYFCEIIGRSEFCLGKIEGKDWTIDLTWAIQSADRIAKILEGGFSGGKHPAKPPSCALPEFADAWDEVLGRMAHHHGKPVIRSWFSNTEISHAEETPDGVMLRLECPREFVRGWIEQHYLTDLNHCWDEQTTCSRPVVGVQLAIKEASS